MAERERSIGDVLKDITRELNTLVRDEVALAKKEVQDAISTAVKDVVLVVAGAVVAYVGVLVLIAAAVLALANVLAPWLSALIIGAVVVIFGVVLLMRGLSEMKSIRPVDRTPDNVREDVRTVKEHAPGGSKTQSRSREDMS